MEFLLYRAPVVMSYSFLCISLVEHIYSILHAHVKLWSIQYHKHIFLCNLDWSRFVCGSYYICLWVQLGKSFRSVRSQNIGLIAFITVCGLYTESITGFSFFWSYTQHLVRNPLYFLIIFGGKTAAMECHMLLLEYKCLFKVFLARS